MKTNLTEKTEELMIGLPDDLFGELEAFPVV
jgi:hypothetical protein